MGSFQQRLQEFIDCMGISMQQFEQQCFIAHGLGKKLSAKSYATTFNRISTAFPELNIEWLKTGEGEMLNPTSVNQSTGNIRANNVCGVNVNGRDIRLSCNDDNKVVLALINEYKLLAKHSQLQLDKAQAQLDKAQTQIDELISLLKSSYNKK